jgi:hypothetical protein
VEFDRRIYSVKVFLREREVGLVHYSADANIDGSFFCDTEAVYNTCMYVSERLPLIFEFDRKYVV